jgi:hypothetical protein
VQLEALTVRSLPRGLAPSSADKLPRGKFPRGIAKHRRNSSSRVMLFRLSQTCAKEETADALVSMLALGLLVAFSAPAFAGTKEPKTQAECTKAGMHWDASAKKCSKGM